jgi:hypothetical protein
VTAGIRESNRREGVLIMQYRTTVVPCQGAFRFLVYFDGREYHRSFMFRSKSQMLHHLIGYPMMRSFLLTKPKATKKVIAAGSLRAPYSVEVQRMFS